MSDQESPFVTVGDDDDADETTFAQGRQTGQIYTSKPFTVPRPASSDYGQPARFVYQVFDNETESGLTPEGEEWKVYDSPAGRYQVKLLVAREVGRVKELWIHRVPTKASGQPSKIMLNLKAPDAQRLVDMLKALDHISLDGTTHKISERLIRDILNDPDALSHAYTRQRGQFRELIENDPAALDVVALAHRRDQVELFHQYLEEPDFFDMTVATNKGGAEAVWQRFFEANPWVLGLGLGSQLLTSWDDDKLEQITTGNSMWGKGKRVDALMATSGRIKSMVFAEVKTHRTPLLERNSYRPGCWAPAEHLSGGVAQVQGTVHRAALGYLDRIQGQNADGTESIGDFAYLLRPKSYLIVGQLSQFVAEDGGHHIDKIRSFELYRRHLAEPEVITFDELLARADWLVTTD